VPRVWVVLRSPALDLGTVRPEDLMLASAKVGLDLSGQKRVFGDVASAAKVVERQHKQPAKANHNAQKASISRCHEVCVVYVSRGVSRRTCSSDRRRGAIDTLDYVFQPRSIVDASR
jgi:hypothetical protein